MVEVHHTNRHHNSILKTSLRTDFTVALRTNMSAQEEKCSTPSNENLITLEQIRQNLLNHLGVDSAEGLDIPDYVLLAEPAKKKRENPEAPECQ